MTVLAAAMAPAATFAAEPAPPAKAAAAAKPGKPGKPDKSGKSDKPGKTANATKPVLYGDAEACVKVALSRSAQIAQAAAKVARYRARMAQLESLYYPKLSALGYVAPMFTVDGSALQPTVTRRWKSLGDWGPHARLQALFAWPLYTFGRIEAGVSAAEARADLEQARLGAVRQAVAFEVRKLWATRAWLLGMQPFLRKSTKQLADALEKAKEAVEEADGSMTQVDVARLQFAGVELRRMARMNADGVALAERALKLAMGLPPGAAVRFAPDARLARAAPKLPTLQQALSTAAKKRPEWAQVRAGKRAAGALVRVAKLANAPALLLGGGLVASWSPTRTASSNPYHRDPFNALEGGVALALQWTFDPAGVRARMKVAKAQVAEVEAIGRYAASGIPTDVFRAWQGAKQACDLAQIAKEGMKATRQWQRFAASAFRMGTSGSRDLLEGTLAAGYARMTATKHRRDCVIAQAELLRATGSAAPR